MKNGGGDRRCSAIRVKQPATATRIGRSDQLRPEPSRTSPYAPWHEPDAHEDQDVSAGRLSVRERFSREAPERRGAPLPRRIGIDPGQDEAAYARGVTRSRLFRIQARLRRQLGTVLAL